MLCSGSNGTLPQSSTRSPSIRFAVVAVGALVLGLSVHSLFVSRSDPEWLLLAGLTILTGSFSVKVPSIHAHISVSEAFVFASVLLFGAEAGTVTVLLECLVILLWMKPQGRPLYRMFFNLAAPSVAIWTAGTCFYLLSGIHPYSQVFTPLPRLFIPLLAFTAAYFLFNSWLVAVAVGLEARCSPVQIWWKNFAWLSVNYFSGASVAALIVTYTQRLDLSTLAVIVPLLVVSYLTFRTAMGRAEDSYNHLSELNRLYLSTIETLAMAIDAKDQITHGHIRRVQIYAVGLAKHVGVTDEQLLKAIEAAALLHDMGKLAVPEHILNKPGKLTPAEFEKMKLHAGVGADILSAIDFPYPVVPIVRHHHENWDGTGYPTGIRGTDIPIGARILSVVDCFDALTSDRPYRPKLSDREALDILIERRGTMYDPLVVDTFIRVHAEISPENTHHTSAVSKGALTEITTSSTSGREPVRDESKARTDIPRALPANVTGSILSLDSSDGDVLRHQICTAIPCDLAILFTYEGALDQLVVDATSIENDIPLKDLRISLGERLSGWVAANRRVIINSDPALDLGEFARRFKPALQSTLSVPLTKNKDLIGVLALYKSAQFSDEERSLAEQIANILAMRVTSYRRHGHVLNDAVPSQKRIGDGTTLAPVSSLVYLEILNWAAVSANVQGRQLQDFLVSLAQCLQASLGPGDLLVHSRDSEFVALLARGDAKDVRTLTRQLQQSLLQLNHDRSELPNVEIAISAILAPIDSSTIWDLMSQHSISSPCQRQLPTAVH